MFTHAPLNRSRVRSLAGVLLIAGGLSACAGPADDSAAPPTPGTSAACPIAVTDPWVKAAQSGMSAAFATLENPTSEPVTVTAASSPASRTIELHEVVTDDGASVMRPVAGGFVVPAKGSLALEPGGYHLMLMDLTRPIEPGDDVAFSLECGAGSVAFTAQAKAYDGAHEEYQGGDSMDQQSDHATP